MEIVINHLTRMSSGYICAAGIEPTTGKHVRPVLERGHLSSSLLSASGGMFEIGARVDLGPTIARPSPPEVEDHVFDPKRLRSRGKLRREEFWSLLESNAQSRLKDIIGSELKALGSACATEQGRGQRSLGVYLPSTKPTLLRKIHYGKEKTRILFSDPVLLDLELTVTDVRLYRGPDWPIDDRAFQNMEASLKAARGALLSVGLPRALKSKTAGEPARHWLQVNNIHVAPA